MKKVTATTLAAFDIFNGLSLKDREKIAAALLLRQYQQDEMLIASDDEKSEVFLLLSGTVRAFANSQDGKQVQYEDLVAGQMFGELSAIDGQPRSNDCRAVDNVTVAVLSPDVFFRVMSEHPAVMQAVLKRLAALVRKHMQRVYEFSTENVGTRVRLEIIRMINDRDAPRHGNKVCFEKVPTHSDIASRISTHREAVTRELKSLEKTGLITWRPGDYVIHDVKAFEESINNQH